jgi:Cys-tRNA(Pro)/Cys-tRNA(Cys) deacylase
MKTNAARLLDQMAIEYEIREYLVDEDDLSAESVAAKIGMPPEQVFKTLVVRGGRKGPGFAVIPAGSELDLKALAKLAGDKKIDTVPLREVQPLTGYIRGGVTVLGAKRHFPVYADESITMHPLISVSSGARGAQLILAPSDYLRAAGGRLGRIARMKQAQTR